MTSHEQRKWLLKLFPGSIHHSFLGEMPGNNFPSFFFSSAHLSHFKVWMKDMHIGRGRGGSEWKENPSEWARLSVI